MSNVDQIIEPERYGIWIAVTFVIALLALVMSLVAIKENNKLTAVTQAEILMLSKKIGGEQPAAPAPAEPAAAAE